MIILSFIYTNNKKLIDHIKFLRKGIKDIKSLCVIALSDLTSHFYTSKCWLVVLHNCVISELRDCYVYESLVK